ncbi:translation initiation factor eIF-2B subunit gamma [Drosophila grimshawi]|uniref:Translation initiation factor eIF2B subunit gamma n=1 Tax=Drosophila grimshawi TaxID=7222 RepID=B4J8E0_DROGR|nr:translation initiation factor eIF-2B subunit gamma [Drosophila grimshawi]EDW02299.1 GH19970 [Drosophila grimshawi]
MSSCEFQAIVLTAGRGTRLPEVLGDAPKCLLPVGPYPLIWYPLNLLSKHNFTEVIVVVLEQDKLEIQLALERTPLKLKIDYATVPSDSDFGTADSLRYIYDKIKSDFLVVSCDIVSNVSLYPLINKFRADDASLALLLFKSGFESDVVMPGPKTKHKPERDIIGIHPATQRLAFVFAASDCEDTLNIQRHLLKNKGQLDVYGRLMDAHIYVLKKWVIGYLHRKENISTFKGEFLPHLIKRQQARRSKKVGQDTISDLNVVTKPEDNILHYVTHTALDEKLTQTSLFNQSLSHNPYHGDVVRCFAIQAPKESIGVRVNTTLSFLAINRKLAGIWNELCGETHPLIAPGAVVKSTQTKEIIVADNAKLSEKTSLSSSVFGSNCVVNPKNIVSNSIIMSNAIVEEGCNINNCIIGHRAHVQSGSVLSNCLIGPNYVVEEGTKVQAVHLSNADQYMEIDIQ